MDASIPRPLRPATLALHAGWRADPTTGAVAVPIFQTTSYQVLQGIETLPLRMEKHAVNAFAVAGWLTQQPSVRRVIHPSQQTGLAAQRARRYLTGGFGGLVGFELHGGAAAGARFIDALRLSYHVANIGDARSLAIHPASTTHSQLSSEEQALTGVSPDYVRLSVGIEDIGDILADLDQALAAATLEEAA